MSALPGLFETYREAEEASAAASVRYARSETSELEEAWDDAARLADERYDTWADYAAEHDLCLQCAGASLPGFSYCLNHGGREWLAENA